MKIRTAGVFAEWAVDGYTMVQHAIDSLLDQQTPTRMDSGEPAVNLLHFAGGEQAVGDRSAASAAEKQSHHCSLSKWFRAKRPRSCFDST